MKNILITGASGDIGSGIARKLAKADVRLLLVYNNSKQRIDKIADELMDISHIVLYKCDLTDDDCVHAMVNDIVSKFHTIDCLINCAGVSLIKQIQDCTEADYSYVFDSNMKTAFLLTKEVSKHMIHEQSGNIINISSMWGNVGASMESLYSASKGAMNSFTLALAKELGFSNIRVNAICPGLIEGRMNESISDEDKKAIISNTPISRIGTSEDVANAVEFLLSGKSSFITGQIITIDGGFSL